MSEVDTLSTEELSETQVKIVVWRFLTHTFLLKSQIFDLVVLDYERVDLRTLRIRSIPRRVESTDQKSL